MGLPEQELATELKTSFDIHYSPTENELNAIIQEWENTPESRWNDVGFKLSGENTNHWLSHSLVKHELDLDIVRDNPEIVNLQSLLATLSEHRTALLGLAVEDND